MPDGAQIVPLFGTGFFRKSANVVAQTLVNMYREPQQPTPDGTPMAFYGTVGKTLFAAIGALPSRGARQVGPFFFFSVHGNTLYSINSVGIYTPIFPTLLSSNGRVDMTDNGSQLLIVDGLAGYVLTLATMALVRIADPDFPIHPTTCTTLGGYGIVDNNDARVGQFNWSSQYDYSTWDGLDFANAEGNPDPLVRVFANAGDLYLFGTVSTEVWSLSGDAAIFRRVGGAAMEWGLAAVWSLDKFSDTALVFLGKNKLGQVQPIQVVGYNTKILVDLSVPSGPDVANDINSRVPASATGYAYVRDAHTFYQLNYPDRSYLYDALSNSWQLSQSGLTPARDNGEVRVEMFGVPYVSDFANGNWYAQSDSVYTDNGNPILREITTRHSIANLARFAVNELFIEFEPGVGIATGQGSDPQAMLQWSKDGGQTFGVEVWQPIGQMGQYLNRCVWRNLGIARDWVFRLRITDPVNVVIINAGMIVS
jgi:hypothetical protein